MEQGLNRGLKQGKWDAYLGKQVRLIIDDMTAFPRNKDGVLTDYDDTHIFLKVEGKELPIPILKSTIRRVDVK